MRRFYYGLLLCFPIYLFVASKEKKNKIDVLYEKNPPNISNDEMPYELKEEYLLLTSIPQSDRDEDINNRIKELENMGESFYEIEDVEINEPIKKNELSPLNVKFRKNAGKEIESLNKKELLNLMYSKGFKNLNEYNTGMLRRIWLAYNYDQFFWDIHYKTNFPISIIYAYFIMEATIEGVESKLMSTYMNPGGIKYRGVGRKIKAYDDCYNKWGKPIKCEFAVFDNYYEMVDGWSIVLNQNRYADCKKYDTAKEICKCLYKSGYHTANNWNRRAHISAEYWKLRASFP